MLSCDPWEYYEADSIVPEGLWTQVKHRKPRDREVDVIYKISVMISLVVSILTAYDIQSKLSKINMLHVTESKTIHSQYIHSYICNRCMKIFKKVLAGWWWWCKPVIPALWEAEAGGFLSSRPGRSTEWVPGQPGLYRETLSWETKQNKNKKTKKPHSTHPFTQCEHWSLSTV